MKKFLLSSAVLLLFSASIIIFQLSCQKPSIAQPAGETENKILLSKTMETQIGTRTDSAGHILPINKFVTEYYTMQYDGTGLIKINIPMPAGEYPLGRGCLTPDGEKLIFKSYNSSNQYSIYSYTLNGTSLLKLTSGVYEIEGAY